VQLMRHGILSRTCAAITLLTFSFVLPAAAEPNDTGTRSAAVSIDTSRIRIDNFGRVNSTYYRGAQPKGSDYADLAALGVKTVINLTSDDAQAEEQRLVEQAGMKYLHIPMSTHRPPTADELARFFAATDEGQPIFVHCVGGKHRTGVMTAAYRMTNDGWTADQAFSEMKQYKFGAAFLHSEFKDYVYGFRPQPGRATPANALAGTAATPALAENAAPVN